MELNMTRADWLFLFLCLAAGIVAEEAFFRYQIGISFFIFIVIFYSLFFWRFRSFTFSHQRFGYLILISIWILAAGYYLYDTVLFYGLNIVVIPALVIFHLALITSPNKMQWNHLHFIYYTIVRLFNGIRYSAIFTRSIGRFFIRSGNQKRFGIIKKVLVGIAISIPVLFIVLNLLISADTQFQRIINSLPNLLSLRGDYFIRFVIILVIGLGIFGYMQVLIQRKIDILKKDVELKPFSMDGIITLTVLLLLDLVYILFIAVQFKYFFSGTLEDGYTYAEYARRGFFELLFVTLINLTVTTVVIQFTKNIQGYLRKIISIALTVLVLSSGVILISAFMRMAMYEDAYGFTFTRVLVNSFMIFLMIILAYTLAKIWLEKLSLFHFYFIAALIYYTGINIVNIDKIVVDRNIDRYEVTGNIDIHYLNRLSLTGLLSLVELYEEKPDLPGLKELLKQRKAEREYLKSDGWQSHNITREKAYEKLGELEL